MPYTKEAFVIEQIGAWPYKEKSLFKVVAKILTRLIIMEAYILVI